MIKNKDAHNPSEIGTLLEHIDDKISLIAEQYTGLNKKSEKLDGKIDNLSNKVEVLIDVAGAMKEDVEIIKIDIEFIKHDLKNKVARDEFAVLERRVALLESRR